MRPAISTTVVEQTAANVRGADGRGRDGFGVFNGFS
jgi:hypothetical protein